MSLAQMIAKAWLDNDYRLALLAQGIDVPPRPRDLADEELVTSAVSENDSPQASNWCGGSCGASGICAC